MNAWLLAWTLLLLADAGNLYDAGFQMSFAATGAILLFLPRLSGICGAGRCGKYMWTYVMVSVVAMAGSGIVAAYHSILFLCCLLLQISLWGFCCREFLAEGFCFVCCCGPDLMPYGCALLLTGFICA